MTFFVWLCVFFGAASEGCLRTLRLPPIAREVRDVPTSSAGTRSLAGREHTKVLEPTFWFDKVCIDQLNIASSVSSQSSGLTKYALTTELLHSPLNTRGDLSMNCRYSYAMMAVLFASCWLRREPLASATAAGTTSPVDFRSFCFRRSPMHQPGDSWLCLVHVATTGASRTIFWCC